MKHELFESLMRANEVYHNISVPPQRYIIIRLDGRNFHSVSERHYRKPFDIDLHKRMVYAADFAMRELGGIYAYIQSDEISILLGKSWNMFNRKVEKIVSISAGIVSQAFNNFQTTAALGHFDSRIWIDADNKSISDYFRWRQENSERNAMQSWCYWSLCNKGLSNRTAAKTLHKMNRSEQLKLLNDNGMDWDKVPSWQKFGTGLYWQVISKTGFSPKTNRDVHTIRLSIVSNDNLPNGDDYARFINSIVETTEFVRDNIRRSKSGHRR